MTRDPLRRKIEAMLGKDVEGSTFERCAADLLRDQYPGLAPVSGGSDAGFDGAITTERGWVPLVCTTAKDVAKNVAKNLTQVRKKRKGPRKAVVATTQSLSEKRRNNIVTAAKKLGFRVLQIHDREDFVNRLMRSPQWRKELLGLAGDPPALSALPERARPHSAQPLIGRETEYAEVKDATGDLLVVGQPGSGKTFLHQRLAQEGRCAFVVSDDLGQITDAIRETSPACLVIDDAHMRLRLVDQLRRLRDDLAVPFRLHLNCWPNAEEECRARLGIGPSEVVYLELMTRDQILEIIHGCGVTGPNRLLHLVLDQADGKPGLAVALVEALKRKDAARVWTGEVLAEHLLAGRRIAADDPERAVLAAFGLGGAVGIPTEMVAQALEMSTLEVRRIVTGLGAGGVIEECGKDRLAVYPSPLRALLVKQVFFYGPSPLKPDVLIAASASPGETAHVLMGARQRGANVPIELLENVIARGSDRRVWEHFAYVDEPCATHVLSHHPGRVADAAPGLLHHVPAAALPALLDFAATDQPLAQGAIEDPKRRVQDWITGSEPSQGKHVNRRKLLLSALRAWHPPETGGGASVLGWGLGQVIAPGFHGTETLPGKGDKLSMSWGVYVPAELDAVAGLWPDVLDVMTRSDRRSWMELMQMIENWCLPARVNRSENASPEVSRTLQKHGLRMLKDVAALPCGDRATRSWAKRMAAWGKLPLSVDCDPDFEILFGRDDLHVSDYHAAREKHLDELKDLARRLAARPAQEAWAFLRDAEKEMEGFGQTLGGHERWIAYYELANLVTDPAWWTGEMIARGFEPSFTDHFLQRALKKDRAQAIALLERMLSTERYRGMAAIHGLGLDPPDVGFLAKALDVLPRGNKADSYTLARASIPVAVRLRLLQHPDASVRINAAFAEWIREPQGVIAPELAPAWRRSILETTGEDEYQLGEILASDPALGFEWVRQRLKDEQSRLWEVDGSVVTASKHLSSEQRAELLALFTRSSYCESCFDAILGEDVTLFGEWFERCTDPHLQIMPLHRRPTERWHRLARVALDKGATPDQVAQATWPAMDGYVGSASAHYEQMYREYEEILREPDARLHATAHRGMAWAHEEIERSRHEERLHEVYGLDNGRRRALMRRIIPNSAEPSPATPRDRG